MTGDERGLYEYKGEFNPPPAPVPLVEKMAIVPLALLQISGFVIQAATRVYDTITGVGTEE